MSTILKSPLALPGFPAVVRALGNTQLSHDLALGTVGGFDLFQNLSFLIGAHAPGRPSSSVGIAVFSNDEDQRTVQLPEP